MLDLSEIMDVAKREIGTYSDKSFHCSSWNLLECYSGFPDCCIRILSAWL